MTDFEYEAFERFCIMTVDGNIDDVTALKHIQEKYGRETAVEIWKKHCKRKYN